MAKPQPAKQKPSGKSLKKIIENRTFIVASRCFVMLVVLILVAIIYYTKVYSDPQRTFWAMVDNNLATNGVTKQTTQQGLAGSTDSITQLVFNPAARVHYIKKVTDKSTKPSSHLTLEGIGTVQADYQRYSFIDRPGSTSNYSSIYNLWLKGDQPTLFGNTVFGAILFGNLRQPQRTDIVNKLRDAYQVEQDTTARQISARTHTYSVTVSLQKYAIAARAYAKVLGLPDADKITPDAYQPTDRAQLVVNVDILSRQLTKIEYKNSNITETYVSYGVSSTVNPPEKTVSNQQFSSALNSIKN